MLGQAVERCNIRDAELTERGLDCRDPIPDIVDIAGGRINTFDNVIYRIRHQGVLISFEKRGATRKFE